MTYDVDVCALCGDPLGPMQEGGVHPECQREAWRDEEARRCAVCGGVLGSWQIDDDVHPECSGLLPEEGGE